MSDTDYWIDQTQQTARRAGIEFTRDQAALISELFWYPGPRNEHPIWEAFVADRLNTDQLTFLASHLWERRADNVFDDSGFLASELWREIFLRCRYTDDEKLAKRPTRPVLAFRGAIEENREGLSWTLDPAEAHPFVYHRPRGGEAQLWVCKIPAERQLARYSFEREVVADVRGSVPVGVAAANQVTPDPGP